MIGEAFDYIVEALEEDVQTTVVTLEDLKQKIDNAPSFVDSVQSLVLLGIITFLFNSFSFFYFFSFPLTHFICPSSYFLSQLLPVASWRLPCQLMAQSMARHSLTLLTLYPSIYPSYSNKISLFMLTRMRLAFRNCGPSSKTDCFGNKITTN